MPPPEAPSLPAAAGGAPARAFVTTIVPFMSGWMLHWYAKDPSVEKVWRNTAPELSTPESKPWPVTVCIDRPTQRQVTWLPAGTLRLGGVKP